jgi:hypothetical protein
MKICPRNREEPPARRHQLQDCRTSGEVPGRRSLADSTPNALPAPTLRRSGRSHGPERWSAGTVYASIRNRRCQDRSTGTRHRDARQGVASPRAARTIGTHSGARADTNVRRATGRRAATHPPPSFPRARHDTHAFSGRRHTRGARVLTSKRRARSAPIAVRARRARLPRGKSAADAPLAHDDAPVPDGHLQRGSRPPAAPAHDGFREATHHPTEGETWPRGCSVAEETRARQRSSEGESWLDTPSPEGKKACFRGRKPYFGWA